MCTSYNTVDEAKGQAWRSETIARAMVIDCNVWLELRHTIPTIRTWLFCESKQNVLLFCCASDDREATPVAMPRDASNVLKYVDLDYSLLCLAMACWAITD